MASRLLPQKLGAGAGFGGYQPPTGMPGAGGGGSGLLQALYSGLKSPLGISTVAGLGGNLLSMFANRGARKEAEGRYTEDRDRVKGQMGKEIYNPYQVAAVARRGAQPGIRRAGANIDRKFGLDSGLGAGAVGHSQVGPMMQFLAQALQREKELRASRDERSARTLLGSSQQDYARY